MENKLIHTFGKERLGKYFLNKGAEFVAEKSYGKAYEFLKEGLDLVTCDCLRNNSSWFESYTKLDNRHLPDINFNHNQVHEYYFVKSYILSFRKQKSDLYIGLDLIDKYLNIIEDEYGFYVKGLIHNSIGEHQEALNSFRQGLHYAKNSRLLYRIGRTKEQFLNQDGLEDLYNSFAINPSSGCCCRILKKYFKERGLSLILKNIENNSLTLRFNENNGEMDFQNEFDKHVDNEIDEIEDICDGEYLHNKLSKFVSDIRINSKLFLTKAESHSGNSNEYHNDYGSSYDEYGGYNDWSDDVINDAFEGDPEATWNVD